MDGGPATCRDRHVSGTEVSRLTSLSQTATFMQSAAATMLRTRRRNPALDSGGSLAWNQASETAC